MPRFNGTGPQGLGSRTGQGLGPCGRGYRCDRGFRRWTEQDEKTALSQEKDILKKELEDVEKELKSLKDQK